MKNPSTKARRGPVVPDSAGHWPLRTWELSLCQRLASVCRWNLFPLRSIIGSRRRKEAKMLQVFETWVCLMLGGEGKGGKRGLFSLSLLLTGSHSHGSEPSGGDDQKKPGLLLFCCRLKPSPQRGAGFVCRLSQLQQSEGSPHELSFPFTRERSFPGARNKWPDTSCLQHPLGRDTFVSQLCQMSTGLFVQDKGEGFQFR